MFDTITTTFNNREIAIFIWVIVFLVGVFLQKSLRNPITNLIEAFTDHKIFVGFMLMIIYIELLVLSFSKLGLWDFTLLKETIYWTFGVGFILYVNMNKPVVEKQYFKKIIMSNLKFALILVFITNFYVFSLIAEIIITPLIIFIIISSAFSEGKKEYIQVKKLFDFLLIFYGITILIFSIYKIITDYSNFTTVENLKSFLFGPIFTIIYLPFIYLLALYMVYETFYTRLKWNLQNNKKLARFIKWRVFFSCRFNLNKIKLVSSKLKVFEITNKQDFKNQLKTII